MRYATKAALITALWLAGAGSVSAADVSEKLTACFACHGATGQSHIENVPSLAAQVPAYSLIQLVMFRDKLRVSDTMNDAAKDLTDSDIQSLADALAALPPPKPLSDPLDQARFERARAMAQQNHCDVCHRPDFSGQQTVPRLAGQREDYLLKTLRDYKRGARRAYEPIMIEQVQPLDDTQLIELSYYLARIR
jgi:cytochrome c553